MAKMLIKTIIKPSAWWLTDAKADETLCSDVAVFDWDTAEIFNEDMIVSNYETGYQIDLKSFICAGFTK